MADLLHSSAASLFALLPDAALVADAGGRIQHWNPAAAQLYGWSPDEVIHRPVADVAPLPTTRPAQDLAAAHRHRDGSPLNVAVSVQPLADAGGAPTGVLAIIRPRQASAAATSGWDTIAHVVDALPIGVAVLDRDLRYIHVNQYLAALTERSPDDLCGLTVAEVAPDLAADIVPALAAVLATGAPTVLWDLPGLRLPSPASVQYWLGCAFPLGDHTGPNARIGVLVLDHAMFAPLATALQAQATLLDHAHVFIRDPKSRILVWNQGAARLYGFSPEDACGRISHELLLTRFPDSLAAYETELFTTGRWEGVLIHRRRDGAELVVASLHLLLRDTAGAPQRILEINTDLTALARAETARKAAARQAELASSHLTSLLANAPIGISLLDTELRFQHINDFLAAINGRPAAEHLGRTFRDVLPELAPTLEPLYQQVLASGMPILNVEVSGSTPAAPAETHTWWASYFPVHDDSGSCIGVGAVILDVTAQRALEQLVQSEREQLQAILHTLQEGLVAVEPNGRIAVINPAALALRGLDPAHPPATHHELQRLGHQIIDTSGEPLAPNDRPIQRVLRGERFSGTELGQRTATGQELWHLVNGTPVYGDDGGLRLGLVTFKDITLSKHDAAALALHADTLSRTNAELGRALRLKDEFLAMMSHELRTPLNAVIGIAEGMQEELYGPMVEHQQRAMTRLVQSGRHLLSLLSDVLDLARIGAGETRLMVKTISVEPLCKKALQAVSQRAAQKRLTLQLGCPPGIDGLRADERYLTQILTNLLDNAVKFTPEGGTVGLEVCGNAADEQIALTVWDTGIGIAAADMGRMFEPFTQVDGRLARAYEGIGLGLTLVKRLTELHGGSVRLTSTPGGGSRFCVMLPWHAGDNVRPAPAAAAPQAPPVRWSRPYRIVVADDHEPTLELYAEQLRLRGCQVTVARTGTEALELIRRERPDIAVLDIQLPALDGLGVLRGMRADPATAHIPAITITALAMPGDQERGLAAGVARYLVKPVGSRALLATIGEVLGATDGPPPRHEAP